MLTRGKIRLHFFLIMASVLGFAIALGKALPLFGVDTHVWRTVIVFACGYVWFFLMIKLWLVYLERTPHMLKQVARYSGKRKPVMHWSDYIGWDLSFVDGILGAILMVVAVVLLAFMVGHLLAVEAPLIMIDAAFEAALAGGLIRTLRRRDDGSWLAVVFKRTIGYFCLALVIGLLIAWYQDTKCDGPTAQGRAECAESVTS